MKTKLTLTMDEELINQAKAHVAEMNVSLSAYISSLLRASTEAKVAGQDPSVLSPLAEQARGLLKNPDGNDISYQDLLHDALNKKYSR